MLGSNKIGRALVGVGFVAMALLEAGIIFGFFIRLNLDIMHKFVNDGKGKRFDAFVVFDIDANQFFIDKVAAIFFAVRVIRYLNIGLILLVANMLDTPIYNRLHQFWLTNFRLESVDAYWHCNRWQWAFLQAFITENKNHSSKQNTEEDKKDDIKF